MFKIVHNIFFVSRFQKEEKKIMEVDTTCEMDKVTVLKKTDNDVEFSLPYGWKKFGHKRKNSSIWDFYLITSDNRRFRSNPEIKRYLENNPTVKCDLSVTNTQWSSALKILKKPNLDLKEPESELFIKSKTTSIIPKLLKICNNVSRSPPSKNNKDKICKERTPESCDQACDGSVAIPDGENAPDLMLAPNSKSDSDFSIEQSKRMLIEKIKGIKSTRHEINSKNVALSKICDDTVEYSLPYGWKKVCHKRKRIDKTTDAYRWDIYIIHPDGKKFRSTIEVERYLDENPYEKCDRSVTNTTPPNDLPKNKSKINKNNDKDEKLNSGIKRKHALKVRKATKTTEVESCGFKSLPILSLATNFSDIDKNRVSAMELDDEKLDMNFFNPWNVSDLSVFLKYCCPECDFKCEEVHLFCEHAIDHHENSSALLKDQQYETSLTNLKQEIVDDDNYENFEVVQEFDDFDEQYGLDKEPQTTSGKESLDSWANFHDFSEKTNIKQEINDDNDESYEAKQEFDNLDEQCSLDEEPKTKSGQKVARKQSSDSRLNFHDFSEETYNPMKKIHDENNDQGKNIKKSLSDIGDYSQKFQCARCDVILKEKARLKRHEEISRSVKNIQTCNECKFRSCTFMGLKNLNHKCSKTKIGETIRKSPRNYSQFCSRCDVILKDKEMMKRHEEISKGVKKIQTCNECGFTSCTQMGLKNRSHKCSKSKDTIQQGIQSYQNKSQLDLNFSSELVEEDVIANNLKYNPKYDEKHDPLTVKSAKKEEYTNEDLDGVAAGLKKYECFVCDEMFCFKGSRRKHMIAFHKNVCHICGSTFQASNEIAKHISGNCKKVA
jgi:hypothetical protein